MGLPLHAVHPARGWAWIRLAFAAWRSRPWPFVSLFSAFLLVVLLLAAMVPVVGGLVGLAMVPMLSLGFMIATRSALAGGPVHVLQLVEGLRTPDKARRHAQWRLCGLYAAASVVVLSVSDLVDGGSFDELMRAMSAASGDKPSPDVDAALADRQLALGMLVRVALITLQSVPFWYAAALVHWGGQGAGQALFSSALALWQARGAFLVYGLGWFGLVLAMVPLTAFLVLVLGTPGLVGMVTLPIAMLLSAVFYISLWFGYVDSFGEPQPLLPGAAPTRAG